MDNSEHLDLLKSSFHSEL